MQPFPPECTATGTCTHLVSATKKLHFLFAKHRVHMSLTCQKMWSFSKKQQPFSLVREVLSQRQQKVQCECLGQVLGTRHIRRRRMFEMHPVLLFLAALVGWANSSRAFHTHTQKNLICKRAPLLPMFVRSFGGSHRCKDLTGGHDSRSVNVSLAVFLEAQDEVPKLRRPSTRRSVSTVRVKPKIAKHRPGVLDASDAGR